MRRHPPRAPIDDAIALLERSIGAGVRDVNLTETLAAAYLEKGRTSEAIRFYEEILAQKPGDKQTLRILGELYTRIEDYNRAAKHYAAMFSDDPEVVREVIQRLEELLKRVGLGDRLQYEPFKLSGGQQQRVAIARALINNPSIVFADEPTGNLDSKTSEEVLLMLQQLNSEQGITIIIVTHDPLVGQHAQRLIHIHDGLIVNGQNAPPDVNPRGSQ